MSRRDTIVIALLINAGLLAILFMLAVNVDDDTTSTNQSVPPSKEVARNEYSSPKQQELSVEESAQDVDTFLKELKTTNPQQVTFIEDDEWDNDEPKGVVLAPAKLTASNDSRGQNYIEVTVKSGDALEKIARNNGTTVEAIRAANNLTSSKLSIGQVLKVPAKNKSAGNEVAVAQKPVVATLTPAPKPSEKKAVAGEPQYYTVKTGDSPWKIAKEFGVEVDQLLKLNGLDEGKARNLKVGDRIRVR